jgi:hypothetical protein
MELNSDTNLLVQIFGTSIILHTIILIMFFLLFIIGFYKDQKQINFEPGKWSLVWIISMFFTMLFGVNILLLMTPGYIK